MNTHKYDRLVTIYDLVFLLLLFIAVIALATAAVSALRGRRRKALATMRTLGLCTVAYIGIVYVATALSKPAVHKMGDAQCNDDWCIAVENAERTPKDDNAIYVVTLRIFSRARRRAQRENIATDVYLVDSQWKRYDPILDGSEIPLNTLLQPGESVTTRRRFELPKDAQQIGLKVGHHTLLPICLIIGECEAFHKGAIIRIAEAEICMPPNSPLSAGGFREVTSTSYEFAEDRALRSIPSRGALPLHRFGVRGADLRDRLVSGFATRRGCIGSVAGGAAWNFHGRDVPWVAAAHAVRPAD